MKTYKTYTHYLESWIQDSEHTEQPGLKECFHPMWHLLSEVYDLLLLENSLYVQRVDTPDRCCMELYEGHAYLRSYEQPNMWF